MTCIEMNIRSELEYIADELHKLRRKANSQEYGSLVVRHEYQKEITEYKTKLESILEQSFKHSYSLNFKLQTLEMLMCVEELDWAFIE